MILLEDLESYPVPGTQVVPMANGGSFSKPTSTKKAQAESRMLSHKDKSCASHHENGHSSLGSSHQVPHTSITPEKTHRTRVPSTSLPLDPPLEVA